jgi:hypothetical protein
MNGLIVLGAERSGVSILAHALAHEEALPLSDDIELAAERLAAGERLVAFATDVTPDCPELARMPRILTQRPQARALVVWRQGVDFVNSRLRARPDQHFVDHCRLWAQSLQKAQQLKSRFPDRVGLIEFRTLVDLAAPERARPLVPGFKLTSATLTRFLNASAHGRTSLAPRRPVVEAERTAWAMGEVEAFARICGPALQSLGGRIDLAAAARRRPLDLARMFYERAYRVGGLDMAPATIAGAAWTIAGAARTIAAPSGAAAPQLRLTAIAAGERRRLRLRARGAGAAGRFHIEVVEALTRRPLFGAVCLEDGQTQASLSVELPAHDGMIEMALVGPRPKSGQGVEPGQGVGLDLLDASLSHA